MKRPVHCGEQPLGCKPQWNYDIHVWQSQHMKCHSPFTLRGATGVTLQHHQILRLPQKRTCPNLREICWKRLKRHLQCAAMREWSDHETFSPQPAAQTRLLFMLATSNLYGKIQHLALRLSFQISPNTVPATKSDSWTAPHIAPATKSSVTLFFTLLFLDSTITWLYYSLTLLLLDSTTPWLYYYLTLLFLDSTIPWLYYYFALRCLSYIGS